MTDTADKGNRIFGRMSELVAALSLAATIGLAGYVVLGYRDRVDGTARSVERLEQALAPLMVEGQLVLSPPKTVEGSRGEIGPIGPQGKDGPPGRDGRDIELRASDTHIQWRHAGDANWIDLVALSDLRGPEGPAGPAGPVGPAAPAGLSTSSGAPVSEAAPPANASSASSLGTGVFTLEKGHAVFVGPNSIPVVVLGETQNGMRFLVDGVDRRPSPGGVVVIGGGPCSMTFMGEADERADSAQVRFAQCD